MSFHQITTCPKKAALGREWSGSELMNYLKNEAPFSILNSLDCLRIISSDISNTRNAKHLIVHMIHSRVKPAPMMNPQDTHLVATVSLLNAKGDWKVLSALIFLLHNFCLSCPSLWWIR